ncbi:MAG: lasso peptide biosynthesis B2 protein [Acidiferrobacterales bacterium]|nr:lasso peptide biosynthesis B2 protein [Acidiferrobacterales bacterium]
MVILVTPFKQLSKLLGIHDGLAPRVPLCTLEQESKARMVGSAIRLAAKYSLWRSDCFPQAMVARFLLGLNKVPYALFMGVRRSDKQDELQAHAWVVSGRVRVTGGAGFRQYTSVGCFVSVY